MRLAISHMQPKFKLLPTDIQVRLTNARIWSLIGAPRRQRRPLAQINLVQIEQLRRLRANER